MKLLLSAWSILIATALAAQVPVEKGVSESLARYRKSVIRNVSYALRFETERDSLRSVVVRIGFDLKQKDQALQIDYAGSTAQVTAIYQVTEGDRFSSASATAARPVPIRVEAEHILVDTAFLTLGRNLIEIHCQPSALALNQRKDFYYSLLVPDRARLLFPCFDQPDLKARFTVEAEQEQYRRVLTNGQAQKITGMGPRTFVAHKEDKPFSTYLFSLVHGDFAYRQQTVNGKQARFYFRETDTAKLRASIDSIFLLHEFALRFMEQYTGIRYPFTKLDFAAIPDFQYGGMEHVGAIDYKASSLFLDRTATKDQRQGRASLIAHEVAHMWFGDLVTMKWFNDVWMKEVFANFMADKITQNPADREAYLLKFMGHLPRAYSVDRTAGAHPIRQSLPNLNQAGTLYGPIIYDKAPVMMQQLELLMGEQAFREGLREYLNRFAYGNADWNDLIAILDRRTPEDLVRWNAAWVNGAGRPVIHYELDTVNGKIRHLRIRQSGEQTGTPILPQQFSLALVYADRVEELRVKLNGAETDVKAAAGKPAPRFLLFNTRGEGYGLFPVDERTTIGMIPSARMRAAAYINLYEQMLATRLPAPSDLLLQLTNALVKETEALNSSMLTGYMGELYWRYLPDSLRQSIAESWEEHLWEALDAMKEPGKKKIYFRLFQHIVSSPQGLSRLSRVWKTSTPPAGLRFSEEEYTSMALQLAVKGHPDAAILDSQLLRLGNPDRQARLRFLMPALSKEISVRDSFFASLRDPLVRKNESWVADALGYLHHPLRAAASVKYLEESLAMLEEIQRTGDIFFPSAWLNATLGGHRSQEAVMIVRRFLDIHPDYPLQLKRKILQAADGLFRAAARNKE